MTEGIYYFQETKAPENYELNTEPIKFEIKAVSYTRKDTPSQSLKIQNKYIGKEPILNIEKIDSDSRKLITSDTTTFSINNISFVFVERNEQGNCYRVATTEDETVL